MGSRESGPPKKTGLKWIAAWVGAGIVLLTVGVFFFVVGGPLRKVIEMAASRELGTRFTLERLELGWNRQVLHGISLEAAPHGPAFLAIERLTLETGIADLIGGNLQSVRLAGPAVSLHFTPEGELVPPEWLMPFVEDFLSRPGEGPLPRLMIESGRIEIESPVWKYGLDLDLRMEPVPFGFQVTARTSLRSAPENGVTVTGDLPIRDPNHPLRINLEVSRFPLEKLASLLTGIVGEEINIGRSALDVQASLEMGPELSRGEFHLTGEPIRIAFLEHEFFLPEVVLSTRLERMGNEPFEISGKSTAGNLLESDWNGRFDPENVSDSRVEVRFSKLDLGRATEVWPGMPLSMNGVLAGLLEVSADGDLVRPVISVSGHEMGVTLEGQSVKIGSLSLSSEGRIPEEMSDRFAAFLQLNLEDIRTEGELPEVHLPELLLRADAERIQGVFRAGGHVQVSGIGEVRFSGEGMPSSSGFPRVSFEMETDLALSDEMKSAISLPAGSRIPNLRMEGKGNPDANGLMEFDFVTSVEEIASATASGRFYPGDPLRTEIQAHFALPDLERIPEVAGLDAFRMEGSLFASMETVRDGTAMEARMLVGTESLKVTTGEIELGVSSARLQVRFRPDQMDSGKGELNLTGIVRDLSGSQPGMVPLVLRKSGLELEGKLGLSEGTLFGSVFTEGVGWLNFSGNYSAFPDASFECSADVMAEWNVGPELLEDLAQFTGVAMGTAKGGLRGSFRTEEGHPYLRCVIQADLTDVQAPTANLAGVSIESGVEIRLREGRLEEIRGEGGTLSLQGLSARIDSVTMEVPGLQAEISPWEILTEADGSIRSASGLLRMVLDGSSVTLLEGVSGTLRGEAVLNVQPGEFPELDLFLEVPRVTAPFSGLEILTPVRFEVAAQGNIAGKSVSADRIRVRVGDLVSWNLQGTASLNTPLSVSVQGGMETLNLPESWNKIGQLLPDRLAGIEAEEGNVGANLRLSARLDGLPLVEGSLSLDGKDLVFLNPPEYTFLLEDGFGGLNLDFQMGEDLRVEGSAFFQAGSLMLDLEPVDSRFLDSQLRWSGTYSLRENAAKLESATLEISRMATLGLAGEYRDDRTSLRIGANLKEALLGIGSAPPTVDAVLDANLEIENGSRGLLIQGRADLEQVNAVFHGPSEFRMENASVHLPFRVDLQDWPEGQTGLGGNPALGTIDPGTLTLGSENLHVPPFAISVWDNTVSLPKGVRIAGFGGNAILDPSWFEGLRGDPHARLSGRIENWQLERVCGALGVPAFGGSLNMTVPGIRMAGSEITLDGTAEVNAFDGRFLIRNIGYDLERRELGFSASFWRINLEKLTQVIPVGRLTGGVLGYVEGFVFSFDTELPTAFDVVVLSDDTVRWERGISYDAIETVVTMARGDLGAQAGVLRQFRKIGYRSIGLQTTLEDWTFRFRGLIEQDGKNYVLLGTGSPRVNIISEGGEKGYPYDILISLIREQKKKIESGEGPSILTKPN